VFVPQRFGFGWTVNWGNRLAWVLVVATIGVIGVISALFV
jgi:uncharacterized membrane protein